jgi:hypothetical protein
MRQLKKRKENGKKIKRKFANKRKKMVKNTKLQKKNGN